MEKTGFIILFYVSQHLYDQIWEYNLDQVPWVYENPIKTKTPFMVDNCYISLSQ